MVNERQSLKGPKVPAQQQQSGRDNFLATWSHSDSVELVIKVWNNKINWF
jgi:hypothetical protein